MTDKISQEDAIALNLHTVVDMYLPRILEAYRAGQEAKIALAFGDKYIVYTLDPNQEVTTPAKDASHD